MKEIISNIHIHTKASDGFGTYQNIIDAAGESGIDVVILTDHNINIRRIENYYTSKSRRIMVMIGEEIHDRNRNPQKNHLLCIGVDKELTNWAVNTQDLINTIQKENGLSFLAHPYESDLPEFKEPEISWVDWNVKNYTGIELWNQLSEFKSVSKSLLNAIFFALFPIFIAHNPEPAMLHKWDELTNAGSQVVAIGGSDAHALEKKFGPMKRTIFPYQFHFAGINTHLLIEDNLSNEFDKGKAQVLNALRNGHCFIGYDWPASTSGFRFSAQNSEDSVIMGDKISLASPITLQIKTPQMASIRLIRNGNLIKEWYREDTCLYIAKTAGTYRVECYIDYWGKSRGWIYSNPIYISE